MRAELIGTDLTDNERDAVEQAVATKTDGRLIDFQAVDIAFFDEDGVEIEPVEQITVTFTSPMVDTSEQPYVVHVEDLTEEEAQAMADGEEEPERTANVVDTLDAQQLDQRDLALDDDQLAIESAHFSTYVLALTSVVQTLEASDDGTYDITVTAPPAAGVSQSVELRVEEIDRQADAETFDFYLEQTELVLSWDPGTVQYVRFFDISLVDGEGAEVQPADGSAVSVDIHLADKDTDTEAQVVHFGDEPEVVAAACDSNTVSFEATGFSVYAIVDTPEVPFETSGEHTASSTEQLADLGDGGLYLSNKKLFLTDGTVDNVTGNADRTGLVTTTVESNTVPAEAAKFYFEQVGTGDATDVGQYLIYRLVDDEPHYLHLRKVNKDRAGLSYVDDRNDATAFTVSDNGDGTFLVGGVADGSTYYWNRNGKNPGAGAIVGYSNPGDVNAVKLKLHYVIDPIEDDAYGLGDKPYGIAFHDDNATSVALTATAATVNKKAALAGQKMVMRPDVLDNDGVLLVAENAAIQEWHFECLEENRYHLTTTVDGTKRYLTIDNGAVTLETEPHETNSVVTVVSGTGRHANAWRLTVGNYALSCNGTNFYVTTGSADSTWLNIVRRSDFPEEDFTRYTAKKVSISDEFNVYNGRQVVVYTRVWNDTTKRYEFYAIDHDGSLVRCFDTGDGIEWIGTNVNTALWDFTEYRNANGTPNFYYELQNVQYGDYIAPQSTTGQVLQDGTIGINLNGRRYGRNFSTIIAWDYDSYSYAGLKVEDGHIVSCPLSESEDFYFAVMQLRDPNDELSEVRTIDSDAYGILMKIYDWNDVDPVANRERTQMGFFGSPTPIPGGANTTTDNNRAGLLSTNLGADGYPTATDLTVAPRQTLANLFADGWPANHLFIESIYNESGYFEYSSTSNFAHFNADGNNAGNFVVYDQLGCNGEATGPTRTHGQFMPFNQIEAGKIASVANQTTVMYQPLPDADPRKGEPLYLIPLDEADYFFGMELSASFTQTADGLDAWGHDIIFEFSGDDDFWFYVDDELVLDLGGVHSAMEGDVNFRTGKVTSSRGDSTLYDLFRANYQARGMSAAAIDARLAEIFEEKTVDGKRVHVFRDYSNHTMRIFYMERGASASNLHMRFNLAAVKPGTFVLSKRLSGTDSPSNDLIEFPYQVFYRSDQDSAWHLLGERAGEADGVTYEGTTAKVRHLDSFVPAGGTEAYEHVFLLKPGQSAEVALPEDAIDYYVVECGVNPAVYDEARANGTVLNGATAADGTALDIPTGNEVGGIARHDYRTPADTLAGRSKVDFDNHVSDGAMRSLSIVKRLYDVDGERRLGVADDDSVFSFRLYLGNESADEANLPLANLYPYLVKNAATGKYCRWDVASKGFVDLEYETYDELKAYLATLTNAQRERIVFATSMNGSISNIPVDHVVEVHDLIVDTKFKVEERDYEIPKGYKLRVHDGYTRVDTDPERQQYEPMAGTIEMDSDPAIEVRNQKGWGLTVEKVWTDRDFMARHDPVYFAVYVSDDAAADGYRLVPGTVRELGTDDTEIYYFFDNLSNGKAFSDYLTREVVLEKGPDFAVDEATGVVSGYTSVTPIDLLARQDGVANRLEIGGQPIGGAYSADGYVYTVHYETGELSTNNRNVRTDVATNSRPGIEIYRTDWAGEPLAGVAFALVDAEGNDVAAETYVSDRHGLVTIAYLSEGTYTLTETATPERYAALPEPLTIEIGTGADGTGTVAVSGASSEYYTVEPHDGDEAAMTATITIRNRQNELRVRKIDGETDEPLAGVHFALYRQVTDNAGNKQKDYTPLPGFESLVTDADGWLDDVTMDLGPGTYYLCETQPAPGYDTLPEDLCFSIGQDGIVRMETALYRPWLTSEPDANNDHVMIFTITISNEVMRLVRIRKVDVLSGEALGGAEFALYAAADFDDENGRPKSGASDLIAGWGTTGEDGYLGLGMLANGEYRLVETRSPAGYLPPATPIRLLVRKGAVDAIEAGSQARVTQAVEDGEELWTIEVWNSSGYELPQTGGRGTGAFVLWGAVLVVGAAVGLLRRVRT